MMVSVVGRRPSIMVRMRSCIPSAPKAPRSLRAAACFPLPVQLAAIPSTHRQIKRLGRYRQDAVASGDREDDRALGSRLAAEDRGAVALVDEGDAVRQSALDHDGCGREAGGGD